MGIPTQTDASPELIATSPSQHLDWSIHPTAMLVNINISSGRCTDDDDVMLGVNARSKTRCGIGDSQICRIVIANIRKYLNTLVTRVANVQEFLIRAYCGRTSKLIVGRDCIRSYLHCGVWKPRIVVGINSPTIGCGVVNPQLIIINPPIRWSLTVHLRYRIYDRGNQFINYSLSRKFRTGFNQS